MERPEDGARTLEQGESLAAEQGLDDHVAVAALFKAHSQLRAGNKSGAAELCRRAMEIARPTGNARLLAEIERALEASREKKGKQNKKSN